MNAEQIQENLQTRLNNNGFELFQVRVEARKEGRMDWCVTYSLGSKLGGLTVLSLDIPSPKQPDIYTWNVATSNIQDMFENWFLSFYNNTRAWAQVLSDRYRFVYWERKGIFSVERQSGETQTKSTFTTSITHKNPKRFAQHLLRRLG